jgi:hypothetical protein
MTSGWFVNQVLPGLIDAVPYIVLTIAGLWLTWRQAIKPHITSVVQAETKAVADAQTKDITKAAEELTQQQTQALTTATKEIANTQTTDIVKRLK